MWAVRPPLTGLHSSDYMKYSGRLGLPLYILYKIAKKNLELNRK